MIIPVTAKIAFSSFADHERLFPIWYHDQVRAHHGCAESDWKRFLEYCCQHRWPSWEYYLSFSSCDAHRPWKLRLARAARPSRGYPASISGHRNLIFCTVVRSMFTYPIQRCDSQAVSGLSRASEENEDCFHSYGTK